jgi:ribonuclease P protein component
MVPKSIRLFRDDTNRVLRTGKRWSTPAFRFTVEKNDLHINRYAVSVRTKKIKTAVARAHTKRVIREWVRLHTNNFPQGFDCVIGCVSEISKADTQAAMSSMTESLISLFTSIQTATHT